MKAVLYYQSIDFILPVIKTLNGSLNKEYLSFICPPLSQTGMRLRFTSGTGLSYAKFRFLLDVIIKTPLFYDMMSYNLVEIYWNFGQTVSSLNTRVTTDKHRDFGHPLAALSCLWQRMLEWAVQIKRNVQLSHIAISGPEISLLWCRGWHEENVAISVFKNRKCFFRHYIELPHLQCEILYCTLISFKRHYWFKVIEFGRHAVLLQDTQRFAFEAITWEYLQ